MEYVVYCDESRHDYPNDKNPFMAIGSLWVPRRERDRISRSFRDLCREVGLHAEVKWSKVSSSRLPAYSRLVDFFCSEPALSFRTIVVEHAKVDNDRYHGGDQELGFYKFYYTMLVKWMEPQNEYVVLLDFKENKGADRYTKLRDVLRKAVPATTTLVDLTIVDSRETPLAQLCDLLTGATAASWCSPAEGAAKAELARRIAAGCGMRSLRSETTSPARCKFNVFRIDLDREAR